MCVFAIYFLLVKLSILCLAFEHLKLFVDLFAICRQSRLLDNSTTRELRNGTAEDRERESEREGQRAADSCETKEVPCD